MRPSVLWVTAIPPDHHGGGGHIRQAYLIDALAARADVHLLVAGTVRDERVRRVVSSLQEIGVAPPAEPATRARRRLRDAVYGLSSDPFEVRQARSIRRALGPKMALSRAVDIVCIEFVSLAPLLPRRRQNHWALTLHNLSSGMARHIAAISPLRRHRLIYAREARKARRLEKWAVDAYDSVFVVSPEDAATLPPGAVMIPNGVDVDRYRPSALPNARRLLFCGALYTLPNVDGITWFCREVWPRVRQLVPDATLDVVGLDPTPAVQALSAIEGVDVHGDVPDTAPYLQRSKAAVIPLRIGTGSRLKALEAMAAGRPIVGTKIGLGGLKLVPGQHGLMASEPEALATATAKLLTDDKLAKRLVERARELVEAEYSWARIGVGYVDALFERAGTGGGEHREPS